MIRHGTASPEQGNTCDVVSKVQQQRQNARRVSIPPFYLAVLPLSLRISHSAELNDASVEVDAQTLL